MIVKFFTSTKLVIKVKFLINLLPINFLLHKLFCIDLLKPNPFLIHGLNFNLTTVCHP